MTSCQVAVSFELQNFSKQDSSTVRLGSISSYSVMERYQGEKHLRSHESPDNAQSGGEGQGQ